MKYKIPILVGIIVVLILIMAYGFLTDYIEKIKEEKLKEGVAGQMNFIRDQIEQQGGFVLPFPDGFQLGCQQINGI